jgi:tripartite-type tricarboxylate transporter receptor subunit TctC
MAIRSTPLAIGKPYGVRAGVPKDRVAMLRQAFEKVMADPQFLAEAKQGQLEIDPISAKEVIQEFNTMMGQPAEAVAAMAKFFKIEGGS